MDTQDAYRLLAAESSIWAIEPARLHGIAAMMAGGSKAAVHGRGGSVTAPAGTAIVPIMGPISHRPSFMSEFFGTGDAGSVVGIRSRLNEALSNRSVERIILDIDSPGGVVSGIPELAEDISAAARTKPVIAVANSLSASAAYWLMSAATEAVATPSAEIGSVGVFMLHLDASRALDRAGIDPTFIFSDISPFKVEGNAFESLGGDARDAFQSDVNAIGRQFIAAVSKGRGLSDGIVKSRFGKGRTLLADDALRAGMVDRIATFEQVLTGRFASPASGRGAAGSTPLPRTTSRERLERERIELDALDKRLAQRIDTPSDRRRSRLEELRR